MTKINLKNLSIDEVLSKDELKKIVGGNGSYPPNHYYYCYCREETSPCRSGYIFDETDWDIMDQEMQQCCDYASNTINYYHCEQI